MAIQTSSKYSLDWQDFGKGVLVAVGSALLPIILAAFKEHHFDWWQIGEVSLSAFSGYLIKNYLTPAKTIIQTPPTTSNQFS